MHATEIYDANLYSGLASLRSQARGNLRPYGKQRDSEFLYDPIIAIKELNSRNYGNPLNEGRLNFPVLKLIRNVSRSFEFTTRPYTAQLEWSPPLMVTELEMECI
ncbi:hypothetical protein CDAR_183641 [Caerostris darwini]|uniref:Uncharacterized protein n=1 Tax=Caerostris darwini TaxID=1538125 RepID=A0AAV4TWA3_9ARAC|nr:hypothetical protein CDAR_183641 [Caerostris darwini]